MTKRETIDTETVTRGRDAASNGPLPHAAPAGSPGARPDHTRHEASAEAGRRAREGAKPYTADTEPYEDPTLADPRDPGQRADARKGPPA